MNVENFVVREKRWLIEKYANADARGELKPELLYESPFTDLNPKGSESVFESAEIDRGLCCLGKFGSARLRDKQA
jgi:hypothetical protein